MRYGNTVDTHSYISGDQSFLITDKEECIRITNCLSTDIAYVDYIGYWKSNVLFCVLSVEAVSICGKQVPPIEIPYYLEYVGQYLVFITEIPSKKKLQVTKRLWNYPSS